MSADASPSDRAAASPLARAGLRALLVGLVAMPFGIPLAARTGSPAAFGLVVTLTGVPVFAASMVELTAARFPAGLMRDALCGAVAAIAAALGAAGWVVWLVFMTTLKLGAGADGTSFDQAWSRLIPLSSGELVVVLVIIAAPCGLITAGRLLGGPGALRATAFALMASTPVALLLVVGNQVLGAIVGRGGRGIVDLGLFEPAAALALAPMPGAALTLLIALADVIDDWRSARRGRVS